MDVGGGPRRRDRSDEEKERQELRDAVLCSFCPLLRALEPYGKSPRILILQRGEGSPLGRDGGRGMGGRDGRGEGGEGEEASCLEAPVKEMLDNVVGTLAPFAQVRVRCMCVYVCVCVCMCMYAHTYIHIPWYTYSSAYMHTCMHAHMHTCMHA